MTGGLRKKMEKTKNCKPKHKVTSGRISLLCWENKGNDGKPYNTYSINKTVITHNTKDRTKFTGQFLSLNGLSRTDLQNLKEAIEDMQEETTGMAEFKEVV